MEWRRSPGDRDETQADASDDGLTSGAMMRCQLVGMQDGLWWGGDERPWGGGGNSRRTLHWGIRIYKGQPVGAWKEEL